MPCLSGHQTVSFGIIGSVFHNRIQEVGEIIGIHLIVAVHDNRNIDVIVTAPDIAGTDRSSYSHIFFKPYQEYPGVLFSEGFYYLNGFVGAAVIDNDNFIDEIG